MTSKYTKHLTQPEFDVGTADHMINRHKMLTKSEVELGRLIDAGLKSGISEETVESIWDDVTEDSR